MKHCIFCEIELTNKNKSKEHVIPKWLLVRIPPDELGWYGKHTTFPNKPEIIHSQKTRGIYSVVLGNVCKNCNNQWLSQLENNTKTLLIAILDDSCPVILTKDQGLTLSKWAFKTVAVLNYAEAYKKIIPISHLHNFYRSNEIPANANVEVAFCQTTGLNTLIGGNKKFIIPKDYSDLKELMKTYIITVQFDHLLMKVSWASDSRFQVVSSPESAVYRIYPQGYDEITIQVVRGSIFRDIAQFHFNASFIIEKAVYQNLPKNEKE